MSFKRYEFSWLRSQNVQLSFRKKWFLLILINLTPSGLIITKLIHSEIEKSNLAFGNSLIGLIDKYIQHKSQILVLVVGSIIC